MQSATNVIGDSLPAIKTPGWGFHDIDGGECLSERARAQVKLLTLRALMRGPGRDGTKFPNGHVLSGVERINARECSISVLFVAAPVGVSVYLPATKPEGILQIERMPIAGFRDGDFEGVALELGLEPRE